MQEQNEKEKKIRKKRISGEKRFYLLTALGCAAALVAIVTVALVASVGENPSQGGNVGNSDNQAVIPPVDEGNNDGNGGNNQGGTGEGDQTVVKPEGMIMPLETAAVIHDYGFYHNQTLNCYYEHTGLDFSAEVGTKVVAVASGTIESIYKDDLLLGTEIVVNHGDGIKSVYRFVNEAEGLAVGDSVEQGEVIATVAEANGNEYKDGAHLHFEITESGKIVDPTTHLTLEEK